MKTYHVGVLLHINKKGSQVAQFQARHTKKLALIDSELKVLAIRQRILAVAIRILKNIVY